MWIYLECSMDSTSLQESEAFRSHSKNGLDQLPIVKTVVQFKISEKEPPQSVSLSLPAQTFGLILDKFIDNNKG